MCDGDWAVGVFGDGLRDRAEQSSLEAAATTRSDGDEVRVSTERDQRRSGRPFDEKSDDDRIGPLTAFGDRQIEQGLRAGSINVGIDCVHDPEIRSMDRCLLARPIESCSSRTRTVDPDDNPPHRTQS